MKILIREGRIVNFDAIQNADILIHNSRIIKIGRIEEKADKEINARGKVILPGLIDMHTHLRTPGWEDREDLTTGSLAAAKGGFTTIFCMPNTSPALDNEGYLKWIIKEAERIGIVDIYPVGAITKSREGKELTEFGILKKAGCLCLSDDGDPLEDVSLLRKALEYAGMFNLLIISHCEEKKLSYTGSMTESVISSKYGMEGIPSISESIGVFRDLELARYLKVKIHLAHISTKRSLEIIKKAKEEGVRVTCETAPHYFILKVEDLEKNNFHANFKVNPPLGEEEDIEAVKEAIKEGVIDCIATDHAPHSIAEKELPFTKAPFGFIGLEFAFALSYTYLVKRKIIDLKGLVEKMSYRPANILGLKDKGYIKEGAFADLAIVDLNQTWEVNKKDIVSKSKNTPFIGYILHGLIEYTFHKGKIVYNRAVSSRL
ncbi:MAG: dihydroorotase [Candidatus Omnitrophica bacterium]|nr:dihydroorotase [Candidatus Omnitrophota bacterium]